jgi:hypothetical protein
MNGRRTTHRAHRSPKFGTAFWQLREPCDRVRVGSYRTKTEMRDLRSSLRSSKAS